MYSDHLTFNWHNKSDFIISQFCCIESDLVLQICGHKVQYAGSDNFDLVLQICGCKVQYAESDNSDFLSCVFSPCCLFLFLPPAILCGR